jgi:broad-specificity NMP kinase
MVTGYLPFEEESIPKLYEKIRENKYSIPLVLSDTLRDLIFRMLQADPSKVSSRAKKRGLPQLGMLENLLM